MKTATIRQVRNDFGTVLGWVNAGEEVTILKRRQPVARLLPPKPAPTGRVQMPDFAARLKARFGKKVVPQDVMDDLLAFNRGRY